MVAKETACWWEMNFFWRDFFFGLKWGTPDGHLRHSHFVGPRGDKDAPSCAGIVLSSAKIHWYWGAMAGF
jgi:hypothetical protein